jgi:DNA-directed RNA polymerase subunit RPC12/RpoP
MNSENRCPRCGEGRLLNWRELDEEQREVVKRLPGSLDHIQPERETLLRWCPRCWFEATDESGREA